MADGNIAAMREAIDDIIDKIDTWRSDGTIEHWQYSQLFDIADAALSTPPRNCDVGSAEEQARRFQLFCQAHRAFDAECSTRCPFVDTADINHCQSGWAQLPYKEEETRKKEEGAK